MSPTDIAVLKTQIDYLAKAIESLSFSLQNHMEKEEQHMEEEEKVMRWIIESLDRKYAAKWTEKVLVFVGSGVWSTIIGALMYLIIIKR